MVWNETGTLEKIESHNKFWEKILGKKIEDVKDGEVEGFVTATTADAKGYKENSGENYNID